MNRSVVTLFIVALLVTGGLFLLFQPVSHSNSIRINGGVQNSTFSLLAEGLAELLRQKLPERTIEVFYSAGSVANLQDLQADRTDFGWAYSRDAYLGKQGQLKKGLAPFDQVRVLGRIYGSAAHLIVPQGSVIESPFDLAGRRVAIGDPGSGSSYSAERYFTAMGIWEDIIPLYVGAELAVEELQKGRAEAIWVLSGFPDPVLETLATQRPVRLLDLHEVAHLSSFFARFPFYSATYIPRGTYHHQNQDIVTFQDNTLLLTRADTEAELVQTVLETIYSPEGIAYLRSVHPIANDLERDKGLLGIMISLHDQAVEFWKHPSSGPEPD